MEKYRQVGEKKSPIGPPFGDINKKFGRIYLRFCDLFCFIVYSYVLFYILVLDQSNYIAIQLWPFYMCVCLYIYVYIERYIYTVFKMLF